MSSPIWGYFLGIYKCQDFPTRIYPVKVVFCVMGEALGLLLTDIGYIKSNSLALFTASYLLCTSSFE